MPWMPGQIGVPLDQCWQCEMLIERLRGYPFANALVSSQASHFHYRDCPSSLIVGQRVRVPMLGDFYGHAENVIFSICRALTCLLFCWIVDILVNPFELPT